MPVSHQHPDSAPIRLEVANGRFQCVVAGLDNTLWGGEIADEGVAGIKLGPQGEGEGFYRLQANLKELLGCGVRLAVTSRNELENAVAPFETHPHMLLRREDVSVFFANWNDPAENIRAIRKKLDVGFDSIMFLDADAF